VKHSAQVMSKHLGWLVIAVLLSTGTLGNASELQRAGRPFSEQLRIVSGQLVKIEGEFYILRTPVGEEFRLQVTGATRMHGTFQVGDMIEVEVTGQGRIKAIRPLEK